MRADELVLTATNRNIKRAKNGSIKLVFWLKLSINDNEGSDSRPKKKMNSIHIFQHIHFNHTLNKVDFDVDFF